MLYSVNQTSASLLLDFAQKRWIDDNPSVDLVAHQRYLLIHDLYIKARSYILINKIAFLFAIVLGIAVIVWPTIAILFHKQELLSELLKSAIVEAAVVQTTITALAGLTFAIYSHYKKRQMLVENLMRKMVYATEWDDTMVELVVQEMERIDSGFGFAQTLNKHLANEKNAEEKSSAKTATKKPPKDQNASSDSHPHLRKSGSHTEETQ